MKLSTISYLAIALSTSFVLANEHESELEPTQTASASDSYTTTAPELALKEYLEHGNNLAARQAGAANLNGAAPSAVVQAGATTVFYMASTIGTTDTWVPFTYVQTFAPVPDQWPSPAAGQIGMGAHAKRGERDVEATPTPAGHGNGQLLVLEMQNVIVTQPVIPVMEVNELVEVPPGYGMLNGSQLNNDTVESLNYTTGSLNHTMSNLNHTTAALNQTASDAANIIAAVNVTATHSTRIMSSKMNPGFMRPPLATAP